MSKIKANTTINPLPIPPSFLERRIYILREQQIMIDSDLAELYNVSTKRLNEAVRRNQARFPKDFIFQITKNELKGLRFQSATSNLRSQFATSSYGGRRYFPYAFTEHGVAMLSSILKSKKAIEMNILIIRAFIKMRQLLAANADVSKRLTKVEDLQKLHHQVLTGVVQDIKKIKNPPKTNAIGFRWKS